MEQASHSHCDDTAVHALKSLNINRGRPSHISLLKGAPKVIASKEEKKEKEGEGEGE